MKKIEAEEFADNLKRDCYEMFLEFGKQSGADRIQQMISLVGVEETLGNILKVYIEKSPSIVENKWFVNLLYNAILYINEKNQNQQ